MASLATVGMRQDGAGWAWCTALLVDGALLNHFMNHLTCIRRGDSNSPVLPVITSLCIRYTIAVDCFIGRVNSKATRRTSTLPIDVGMRGERRRPLPKKSALCVVLGFFNYNTKSQNNPQLCSLGVMVLLGCSTSPGNT